MNSGILTPELVHLNLTLKLYGLPEFKGLLRMEFEVHPDMVPSCETTTVLATMEIVSQMLVNLYYSCFHWGFATWNKKLYHSWQ